MLRFVIWRQRRFIRHGMKEVGNEYRVSGFQRSRVRDAAETPGQSRREPLGEATRRTRMQICLMSKQIAILPLPMGLLAVGAISQRHNHHTRHSASRPRGTTIQI